MKLKELRHNFRKGRMCCCCLLALVMLFSLMAVPASAGSDTSIKKHAKYYEEPEFKSYDGTPLYVRESGSGPLLLLIHGAATDADFWHDAGDYLSQHFHVISYDRRGYVRSGFTKNSDDILTAHAKDAFALIQRFGNGQPAYVIGHSLGGPVAMKLAELHPEVIKKLMLFEPVTESDRYFQQEDPSVFFPPLKQTDPRGRAATDEESANVLPDTLALKYDKDIILNYRVPYDALKNLDVLFAVGEDSKGTLIYNETLRMAQTLNKPVIYYPGVHNSAFDFPEQFSTITTKAFLNQ